MLRPYQESAVKKMVWSLGIEGNSVVSLPTGSGKTHIIAEFANRINQPLLILVPSKELLEQDLEKLLKVVNISEVGIYSASMNSKDVCNYTLATIQSAYKHPEKFAHYNVVIIDECHQVNVDKKKSQTMYQKFFREIGDPKVIGLTATPYRLDSFYKATGKPWMPWETVTTTKMINRYSSLFWRSFIYVINTQDLIDQGYLCELKYKEMSFYDHSEIPTNKSASDFDLKKYEDMLQVKEQTVVNHLLDIKTKHKSILVFCSSVKQAERLQSVVTGSEIVTGKTPKKHREKTIESFKSGQTTIVFNVGVLTTGFDHPELDAIVLLRPTRSLNLHNQILGRLTRKAEGKEFGTVYDFSGNVKALGKLETIKVEKIGKWNVVSETFPDGFHKEELYKFGIRRKDGTK